MTHMIASFHFIAMPTVDYMRKWHLLRLRNDLSISKFVPDLKQPRLALNHNLGNGRIVRAHFLWQTEFTISHLKEVDEFIIILFGNQLCVLNQKVHCSEIRIGHSNVEWSPTCIILSTLEVQIKKHWLVFLELMKIEV